MMHCRSSLTESHRWVYFRKLNFLDIGPVAQRPGRSCSHTQIRS